MRPKAVTALIAITTLGACTGGVNTDPLAGARDPVVEIEGRIGDMIGERSLGGVTLQGRRDDPLAGNVNRQLWLASLDTLSFLPIASTDPFSGVIATDWGSLPDGPAERFRVTAFVTSTALAPESLRVAVFRETRDRGGNWVTAPVSAETPRALEDSILVRARQIRIAERAAR